MTAALGVFEVSVKRILIKLWTTSGFILKQLNYSFSISMGDSWLRLRLSNVTRMKANSGYSCGNVLEPCAKFRGLKWGINFSYRSETGYGKSQILALNRCKFQGLGCTSPPKLWEVAPPPPSPPVLKQPRISERMLIVCFIGYPCERGKE